MWSEGYAATAVHLINTKGDQGVTWQACCSGGNRMMTNEAFGKLVEAVKSEKFTAFRQCQHNAYYFSSWMHPDTVATIVGELQFKVDCSVDPDAFSETVLCIDKSDRQCISWRSNGKGAMTTDRFEKHIQNTGLSIEGEKWAEKER